MATNKVKGREWNMIDILNLVDPKRVAESFKFYYPNVRYAPSARYLNQIKKFKAMKPKYRGEKLVVNTLGKFTLDHYSQKANQKFFSLKEAARDDIYYRVHTAGRQINSISFRPWREVASMPIEHETLNRYSLDDLSAHFLYEIGWYGNEKSAAKKLADIEGKMKDIIKDYKQQQKNNGKAKKV